MRSHENLLLESSKTKRRLTDKDTVFLVVNNSLTSTELLVIRTRH